MNSKQLVLFLFFKVFLTSVFYIKTEKIDFVTIAILAKDKAHTLPLYLECIEKQTWPKDKTYLYIRTNNNNDNTVDVLKKWIVTIKDKYAGIFFDDSNVIEQVEKFGQHEWNSQRFKVLGKIRQESVKWAHEHNSHYFVVDCDNFIKPQTLEFLIKVNLPIVAPLLRTSNTLYSNFHAAVDASGYFAHSPLYCKLLGQEIKGLIEVPVVHCTYLVRHEVLNKITYDDESYRYEYVIFSDSARKNNILQYLDTRYIYGKISFAENATQLQQEPWIGEFKAYSYFS